MGLRPRARFARVELRYKPYGLTDQTLMISVLAPRLQISLSEICRHVWESFKLTYKGFGTDLWLTFHCVIFQVNGRGCLFFPSPVQKLRHVLINLYFYLLTS